jgi:hypothetical protein
MAKHNRNEPEHMEHVTHTKVGSGYGHAAHSVNAQDDKWDHPPVNTSRVSQSAVRTEHYPRGGEGGEVNSHPEGRGVLGDLNKAQQTRDSPVPMRDRQMPDKDITSKAQEVAAALHHSEGEGFPGGGVLGR